MAWGHITGEDRLLPGGGGGIDEVKLETDKPKRLRLLLPDGAEPYTYLEHALEFEAPKEGGGTERVFRTVRCPKTAVNPNAHCPICDGQRFRRRIRNAANVWDYDLGKVQKLSHGESVWKPIATTRKMGIDVTSVDWAILRTGKDRNDTDYSATNLGPTDFNLPEDAVLFNIEQDFAPNTIEEMQAIVESMGMTWEFATTLPSLTYPTLEDALNHVMPNGKYKDQTFRAMWEADQTNRGMINFLATKSDRVSPEKAAAQVILVNLGGANIDGVPRYNGTNGAATGAAPKTAPAPAAAPASKAKEKATEPPSGGTVSGDRTNKINDINKAFGENQKFVDGGFQVIMDTMKAAGNGKTNIQDFTDAELDALLAATKE